MNLGLHYKNQDHIFDEKEVNGVPFLSYPMLEETGIVNHGFSTRLGGVSKGCWATMNISTTRGDDPEDVRENQRRIAGAIGVQPEDMTFTNQTHTTNVAVVKAGDKGKRFQETDGMITDVPGICLVTSYADCIPLFFADSRNQCIGLSHSGWRGTVGNIAQVTVDALIREYNANPAYIKAVIGPGICRGCYEVSEDVAVQFQKKYLPQEAEHIVTPGKRVGKYQLDLQLANYYNLIHAGIHPEHIAVADVCTCCNSDLLFSHRATKGRRGILCGMMYIKE